MFSAKPNALNKQAIQFSKEMVGRMGFALRDMPVEAAEDVLQMVLDAIPSGSKYSDYKDALGVYEVVESDPDAYVTGVFGKPKPLSLKMIDTLRSVLYIRPSNRSGMESEAAMVLRQYEPWTVSTLPYEPAPDEADVIARRVSPREVNLIELQLKKVLPLVERQLKRLGITPQKASRILLSRKVLLDLSFFALRLEFGQQGFPYRPHWRPALRSVMTREHPKTIQDALLNPKFRGWKKFPKINKKVPASSLQVDDFQDRTAV